MMANSSPPSPSFQASSPNATQGYSRQDIANGLFQKLGEAGAKAGVFKPLSDKEREASLQIFLASQPIPHEDKAIWVFAYGSLIWNPAFQYRHRCHARIYGFHRALCLLSPVGRGCVEKPGLLFGLDEGGSCCGIAYQIHPQHVEEELRILWAREMMGGSYRPVWLKAHLRSASNCDCDSNQVTQMVKPAISFAIRQDTNRYYQGKNLDDMAGIIHRAKGELGSNRDYFDRTYQGLQAEKIGDRLVETIQQKLVALDHQQTQPDRLSP